MPRTDYTRKFEDWPTIGQKTLVVPKGRKTYLVVHMELVQKELPTVYDSEAVEKRKEAGSALGKLIHEITSYIAKSWYYGEL